MNRYIFLLGREPELSLAELRSLFSVQKIQWNFALISSSEEDIDKNCEGLGGTIKIGRVLFEETSRNALEKHLIDDLRLQTVSGKKLRFGIDTFISSLSRLVFQAKEVLKKEGYSLRVIQHENWRIKTATTLHEKLIQNWVEYIVIPGENSGYLVARTVWVQNIDAYSQRDIERNRSMKVGMMPPKLAQIMINLATHWDRNMTIWDPFCWLGTTLIEAIHAGYIHLIGSDIDQNMVRTTQINLTSQKNEEKPIISDIFKLDAREMHAHLLKRDTALVTEGFLGYNFSPGTLSYNDAKSEREKLIPLYKDFLWSAYNNAPIRWVAFCLPFWNTPSGRIYMPKIEDMNKNWNTETICRQKDRYLEHTRMGQQIGREIVVLSRL